MSPTPTLKKVKDTLLVEYVGNGNPAYDPDPLIKKKEAFTARGFNSDIGVPLFIMTSAIAVVILVILLINAIKYWDSTAAPKPGRYNEPPPEPAEEIGAHFAVAACSTQLEHAFATIMTSQSGASPAPDPYEVEVAFKIVYESALPINDADSD
ncbi:hypothetical protein BT96DRAFT_943584 [Gymnopus androsaceus JB14]|uniref:Uncharacterized protein n=1 Tax=Gymnopus androsaceus JB14 TaxID=1447944 RepID=A0A6A4H8B5_9AGAR|nr:hypothetical protein BT96DRAFT_943584 [Gymnopus androsaceus JB14]